MKYDEDHGVFIGKWYPYGQFSDLYAVSNDVIYQCKRSDQPAIRDTFDCTYERVDKAQPVVQVVPYGYKQLAVEEVDDAKRD